VRRGTAVTAVVVAIGLFNLVLGLWAFFAPASFFERIASYPPYSKHLIHDLGAFQSAIGSGLLFSLLRADAILATLFGASVGGTLHFFSHLQDRSLGGRATDPLFVGILAIVVVLAAVLRARDIGRGS
jgi:uncharacterized membrane protein HdeD (DUF308 family)